MQVTVWIQSISKLIGKSFIYNQFSSSPGYPSLFFTLRERAALEASSAGVSKLHTTSLKMTSLYRYSLRTFYFLLPCHLPILSSKAKNTSTNSVAWWWWPLIVTVTSQKRICVVVDGKNGFLVSKETVVILLMYQFFKKRGNPDSAVTTVKHRAHEIDRDTRRDYKRHRTKKPTEFHSPKTF